MALALVVEPNASLRGSVVHLAERAGYEVVLAEDGKQAIGLLRQRSPELLVTELSLPQADGFEVLRAAEHLKHRPRKVVISAFRALRDDAYKLKGELRIDALLASGSPLSSIERAIGRAPVPDAERPDPVQAAVLELDERDWQERSAAETARADAERIAALREGGLLDEPLDQQLQALVAEVAQRFGVPTALISFVLEDRQWFKAYAGLSGRLLADRGSERESSFCRHVVGASEPLVVPDAVIHPTFARNALVTEGLVRGYAGAPLVASDGEVLGTLCIIDAKPLHVDAAAIAELKVLARRIAGELEVRVQRARLSRQHAETAAVDAQLRILQAVLDAAPMGVALMNGERTVIYANRAYGQQLLPVEKVVGQPREAMIEQVVQLTADPEATRALFEVLPEGPFVASEIFEVVRPIRRVLRWTATPVLLPEGQGQLATFEDVTAEVDLAKAREALALVDGLTGLANRRGGEEALARDAARGRREQKPLGLVLFDIDHFKRINDTHGHATGDEVLRQVGDSIRKQARPYDTIVRWGGEELVAILPGESLEGARAFAERARAAVEALSGPGQVTVSAGVAELAPGGDALEAVARADAAMYRAKNAGRNRVEV